MDDRNWFAVERVRDDFDRGLQCLEPPLAIASMGPIARMPGPGRAFRCVKDETRSQQEET
jgi:hypothetical protein